jgi:hypothetical protein
VGALMQAVDPIFFEPPLGFTLHRADGTLLWTLPPNTRITSTLGKPDPYTWDRSPGSPNWFPLGDEFGSVRPVVTLAYTWVYPNDDAAINEAKEVERALRLTTFVQLRGAAFAELSSDAPGFCSTQFGARLKEVTQILTLNTLTTLTAEALQEAQQL